LEKHYAGSLLIYYSWLVEEKAPLQQ